MPRGNFISSVLHGCNGRSHTWQTESWGGLALHSCSRATLESDQMVTTLSFSLQEKMYFSCAEVDEKMKTGKSSFYTISELWVQLAFRKKQLVKRCPFSGEARGQLAWRSDRHLKFTPNLKHLFHSFSMDLSSPSHPGREHDTSRTRDTEGSIANKSRKAQSQ